MTKEKKKNKLICDLQKNRKGDMQLSESITKPGIEDITKAIHVLDKIYDVVRIVDPMHNKVMHLDSNNAPISENDDMCYAFWEKNKFCDNCISLRAATEMDTFVKFEIINKRIYMITASPVSYHNGHCGYVIEMLNDITDKSILESIVSKDTEDFTSFVFRFNDALVRDELTMLFNRRYINERLPVEIFNSIATEKPATLIMADIDNFKKINDNYGHIAGDMILQQFAQVLDKGIRSEKDWVARYGGEEFLFCLHNTDSKSAKEAAELIREIVESTKFNIQNGVVSIRCSFGICTLEDGMNTQDWINSADKKLYLAKVYGGNKVC